MASDPGARARGGAAQAIADIIVIEPGIGAQESQEREADIVKNLRLIG